MSLVAVSCSTATTSPDATGSTKHAQQTTGTSTAAAPVAGAGSVTALCAEVYSTQATLERTKVVPADEVQKILADSQSSGNHTLASEASTLASASHVVDQAGTAAALAAMVATCHEVTAGS